MRVALVNTNRIVPPIAPIGLEYVAEALCAAGHQAEILDLCWEERWEQAIAGFLGSGEHALVGVSIRNTDDCSFATRSSFLPDHVAVVKCIREHTDAPIVLGGVGFSIMPEEVLARCGADAGIWGKGNLPWGRSRTAWRKTSRGTTFPALYPVSARRGGETPASRAPWPACPR